MLLILMDTREADSKDMGAAGGMFFCVAEIGGFSGYDRNVSGRNIFSGRPLYRCIRIDVAVEKIENLELVLIGFRNFEHGRGSNQNKDITEWSIADHDNCRKND